MDNLERYKAYREHERMFIATKIMNYVNSSIDEQVVLNSARILGMLDSKGNIAPKAESEMLFLLDFVINEYKVNGKSIVQLYRENVGAENELEEAMLKALENSYMSLFRVVNISPSKNLVFLKDAFNRVKNVRLTDMNFSQTGDTDTLLFVRVLPYEELNMTSGMGATFPSLAEDRLLIEYKRVSKEMNLAQEIDSESARMLIAFFHFNREVGTPVKYDW
ncbi:hypothetical protein [Clostridium ganghwense]|uniref:DUF2313 domain-containing protein n=1 Tax=Clostridium ganghwense TaxID=312089 RepID=A0ABT4CQW9_9CLOT|nr:hypothetical protein [Clostridium ganghwense]MCY6371442.1 hypothetical protein [Clostridium ganghwense]